MSRLYDALKGAASSRQGADGVWEALGINGTDVPSTANDPDVMESAGLADDLATVFPDEDLSHSVASGQQDCVGGSVKVVLDPKARLIPHARDPIVAEHYRKLRTKILQQQEKQPFRSLVVTSANPQEGKTVTVLNLGLSFATLPSFKVLVVDGDMRRGTLGQWLGVDDGHAGLSNLIDGSAQLDEVLLRSDEVPMHFIMRGNSRVPDLHSSQLTSHFQRLTEQFDLVLVDTSPVNLIADVQLLAESCDAVLLVARAFVTTRKSFEKAIQDLSPFRMIGTVLNAGEGQSYGHGKYY